MVRTARPGARGEAAAARRWCPCAPRSGLPRRRSVSAAVEEGQGEGEREGGRGRRPGEERGSVCSREGRPAASCFLSVSGGAGGGRGRGRDRWSPRRPIPRPGVCLPPRVSTYTLLPVRQGVEELQDRVTARRLFGSLLGPYLLNFFNMKKCQHLDRTSSNPKEQVKKKKYPVVEKRDKN